MTHPSADKTGAPPTLTGYARPGHASIQVWPALYPYGTGKTEGCASRYVGTFPEAADVSSRPAALPAPAYDPFAVSAIRTRGFPGRELWRAARQVERLRTPIGGRELGQGARTCTFLP